jgi:hypothetical protein
VAPRAVVLVATFPFLCSDATCVSKSNVAANGFRELYKWLDGADLLIVHADRCEPLAVVRLRFAAEIAALAEHSKKNSA